MELAGRVLRAVERLCSLVAIVAFVAIVLITVGDAALRYLFSRPLAWSFTVIANYLMAMTFVLGIPEMQRMNGHITMEFFRLRLSDRGYAASVAAACALGCCFCLLVAAYNVPLFITAVVDDERVPSAMAWPLWPSYAVLPIGFGLAAARFAAQAGQAWLAVVSGAGLPKPAPGSTEALE